MNHLATRRHYYYALSLTVIIPGLISLLVFGLNLGIDFTGGTLWELKFDKTVQTQELDTIMANHGYAGAQVQLSSEDGINNNVALIRSKELKQGSPTKSAIENDIRTHIGDYTELSLTTVGGSVGSEISKRAVYAIILAAIGILLYIAYAFRNTQNPLLYGICAIVAMLHDVIVVLGIFSILGEFAGVEIDALFVTALLTVIGFSVHDTIVVFDRIRENLIRRAAPTFIEVVNYSLAQTIVRSLNTSLTVTFTLLALYLFGGESTKEFILALLIGIISGTYSSIFNASQLLVSWESGEIHRLFRRTREGTGRRIAASQ
ncbi:MAG TPA: protein translocase subunit SecF [Thermomicrobiales bacterium]|nr:protein translocase subunit SecF [Thermomicrobiales bacterium]